MRNFNLKYKVDMTKVCIILLSLVIAALITGGVVDARQEVLLAQAQEHLAQEVLRFHILANSDSEEDQALKMTVKERVLDWMKVCLPEDLDVDQTRMWLREHSDEIEEMCAEEIEAQGYDYPVSAAVTTCYFPEKTYGDVTFPAGNYEALRIEIGAAKGHNWWCVLYPNLCFLDAVHAVVPEEGKEELKQVLTEEEYELFTSDSDVRIRSFFLDRLEK
ncbi:MAG: stage II sporulation protein R [Hespellia sp.]|nr:stage II sporulation protein R [Hespellia sp.]